MSEIYFKKWLLNEFKDIFGFEKFNTIRSLNQLAEPNVIKSEILLGELSRMPLGSKTPKWEWSDEISWGDNKPGDLKIDVGPLGSYKVIIRRKTIDLEGNSIWYCKKIVNLNEAGKKHKEDMLAGIIYEDLQKIDAELMEMPRHEYNLENLVLSLASKVKGKAPIIFVYEGIRKKNNNNYIIWFSARGHGVEAPDSRRLEQFNIDLSFNPKTGMIRCFGHDISSPMKGHLWEVQPSEWDEYFISTQPKNEIEEAVIHALLTY